MCRVEKLFRYTLSLNIRVERTLQVYLQHTRNNVKLGVIFCKSYGKQHGLLIVVKRSGNEITLPTYGIRIHSCVNINVQYVSYQICLLMERISIEDNVMLAKFILKPDSNEYTAPQLLTKFKLECI